MSEQTEYVNYGAFKNHIFNMTLIGKNINSDLKDVYKEIEHLREISIWKGPQYDKLVDCFNGMVDGFNVILEDIGYRIPNMMNESASAWAAVDGANYSKSFIDTIKKLTPVEHSYETALTINQKEVYKSKDRIERKLDDVVESIGTLALTFKRLNTDWRGKDFDDNLEDIRNYQNEITKRVEELKNDFVKYMNETLNLYALVKQSITEWK